MGITHRDSEEVITELAESLAVKLYEREFDQLALDQQCECWNRASEDYISSRIDYYMDRVESLPCPV